MKSLKIFAVLAASIAIVACAKEQAAPEEEAAIPQEPQTEQTDVPEGYVRLTFSTPAETKTSIDKKSGAVSWSAGDRIKICWEGDSAVSDPVEIEGGVARFTANVSAAADDLYAVYPASITASVSSGTFSVDIPQSQTGLFKDADIIVAKTTKTERTYAFHHAVSLVRFEISEGNSRSITRAQFVDLANNSCLYGTLGITFSGTDIDEITPPATETNDVIDITTVAEGDNWIALPPKKSLSGYGLRMGTISAWLPGIVGEKAYEFTEAGKRLGLGTVDEKINDGDWYIKPEATGTGDGKSWENAGGPEMLQSLMGKIGEYNGYKHFARAWRLDGETIKVAEGEYSCLFSGKGDGFTAGFDSDAWDSGISFIIEGGYTSDGVKAPTAKTVFGSNTTPDSGRAFFFYSSVNATLKDLVIKNHTRTNNGGGPGIYAVINSILVLEGCTFEDNIANGTTSGFGGAIHCKESSTSLYMTNCTFKDNVACDGGAIYSKGIVRADKCKFIGNHTDGTKIYDKNSNGRTGSGVIVVGSDADAFFNSCEFRGNYARVTNNANKQAGNITFSPGQLGLNNCTLYNNNSTEELRAVWSIQSSKKCVIINTTMIDDTSNGPSQGSYINNSSSILYNNIIIGKGGAALFIKNTAACTHDYNIISGWLSGDGNITDNNDHEVTSDSLGAGDGTSYMYDTHAAGIAGGVSTGMSYYYWNGTSPTFGPTNKSAVSEALSGTAFLDWLDSLVDGDDSALDYDIRGVKRSSGYWPGSYQE